MFCIFESSLGGKWVTLNNSINKNVVLCWVLITLLHPSKWKPRILSRKKHDVSTWELIKEPSMANTGRGGRKGEGAELF